MAVVFDIESPFYELKSFVDQRGKDLHLAAIGDHTAGYLRVG